MFFNLHCRWSSFLVSLIVCLIFFVDPGSSQNLFEGKWSDFKNIVKKIDVRKDLTDTVYEKIERLIGEKILFPTKPYPYYIKELDDEIQKKGKNDQETAKKILSIYRDYENKKFQTFLEDLKFTDFESDISKAFMRWVQKEEHSERVYEFANTIIDFWEGLITEEILIAKIQNLRFLRPIVFPKELHSWIEKNKTKQTSHSTTPLTEHELLEKHRQTTWLTLFFPEKQNLLSNFASQQENLWFNHASEYNTFLMNMHIKRSEKLGNLETLILLQNLQLLFSPKKFSAALLKEKEAAPASHAINSLLKYIKESMKVWNPNGEFLIEKKFDLFLDDYNKVLQGECACVRSFNDVFDTLYAPEFQDVIKKIEIARNKQYECKMYLWARGIDIQYILESLSQNQFRHVYLALPIEVNQIIAGILSKEFLKNIQRSTFSQKTYARRTELEIEAWKQFMKKLTGKKTKFETAANTLISVLIKTNVDKWTDAQIILFVEIYEEVIEGQTKRFSNFLSNRYNDYNLNEAVKDFLEELS